MISDKILYSLLLAILLLCSRLASGQAEDDRQDQPGLRMSWFSAGLTAGLNNGLSLQAGIWRYGKLELSFALTDYTRYREWPDQLRPDWRLWWPQFALQVVYRQYWPGSVQLYGEHLYLDWGLSGGAAYVFKLREGSLWGAVGGAFCEFRFGRWVSLQADLLFFRPQTLEGPLKVGPVATLYVNF